MSYEPSKKPWPAPRGSIEGVDRMAIKSGGFEDGISDGIDRSAITASASPGGGSAVKRDGGGGSAKRRAFPTPSL